MNSKDWQAPGSSLQRHLKPLYSLINGWFAGGISFLGFLNCSWYTASPHLHDDLVAGDVQILLDGGLRDRIGSQSRICKVSRFLKREYGLG